jgi:hypothetical protein
MDPPCRYRESKEGKEKEGIRGASSGGTGTEYSHSRVRVLEVGD